MCSACTSKTNWSSRTSSVWTSRPTRTNCWQAPTTTKRTSSTCRTKWTRSSTFQPWVVAANTWESINTTKAIVGTWYQSRMPQTTTINNCRNYLGWSILTKLSPKLIKSRWRWRQSSLTWLSCGCWTSRTRWNKSNSGQWSRRRPQKANINSIKRSRCTAGTQKIMSSQFQV